MSGYRLTRPFTQTALLGDPYCTANTTVVCFCPATQRKTITAITAVKSDHLAAPQEDARGLTRGGGGGGHSPAQQNLAEEKKHERTHVRSYSYPPAIVVQSCVAAARDVLRCVEGITWAALKSISCGAFRLSATKKNI